MPTPLLRPEIGTEHRRGVADLHNNADLLIHRETEAAIAFWDGHAEKAELLELSNDARRDVIRLLDLRFGWDQLLTHESGNHID